MEIIFNGQGRFEKRPKLNEEGKPLFWLPQPPLEEINNIPRRVQSIDPTDNPVIVTKQVPLMSEGEQASYEVTQPVYEQIPIYDEEENIIGYSNGEIIGQEGTGQFLKLWTTEQVQAVDEEDNLLYWDTEYDEEILYVPQEPIEITEDDPDYVEGLEQIFELIPIPDPPQPPRPKSAEELIQEQQNEINILSDSVDTINVRTQGMQDIDDFTLQQVMTADERTLGLQDIDDYSLGLIFDMQALIDAQAQKITELENRIITLEGGTV